MITVILLAAGAFVVVGFVVLAMTSGARGGRNGQSSREKAMKQMQTNSAKGGSRGPGID
jgi:hypothetical protein